MNAPTLAAAYLAGGTVIASAAVLAAAAILPGPGHPSMRQSAAITWRIVTGRRRTRRVTAPPPALYVHPHIERPISDGTPLAMLGAHRANRERLKAAIERERIWTTYDGGGDAA